MRLTSKTSSQLTLVVSTLFIICLAVTIPTGGQSGCTPLAPNLPAWPRNSTVYINLGNLNTEQRRQVTLAINAWNQANQSNGSYVSFSFNTPPSSTSFRLDFKIAPIKPDETGQRLPAQLDPTNGVDSQGNLNHATVTFDPSVQGADQNGNFVPALDETVSSNAFLKSALHELGHSMGFGEAQQDPAHPTSGACANSGQIPTSTVMNSMCGANDWGGNVPTTVTPCDNQRVSTINQYHCTLSASSCSPRAFDPPSCVCYDPPPPPGDGSGCPATECNQGSGGQIDYCLYSSGCPEGWINTGQCCQPWNITPIVIDVDGSGFSLTDTKRGVQFDFFGIKKAFQLSWTAQNSTNAFLVLDRDANGTIDSGRELFGNMTPQPKSSNANGFLALAEFDKPENGGNADRMIDHRDTVYGSLRLWQDNNHNGVSEATELHGLAALGVESLELDYKLSKKTDEYGNQFRYRAKVKDGKGEQAGRWAWDVIFVAP